MLNEFTQADEYNQQGKVLYSLDKYEESIAFFLKAEQADPMKIQTYFNLTEAYVMLDRFSDAKKALKRAQMVDKNNGEIYFHLGNIVLLEGQINEGKQHYAKAVTLGFANPYIYMNLGSAYEDLRDIDSALSSYNKAIQLDRFFAPAWLKKLELFLQTDQYSEALSVSDSMINFFPDKFEGYHYKFAILMESGDTIEAKNVLDRALELFPDDPGFIQDKIRYFEAVGSYSDAEKLLDQYFFEAPDSAEYSKMKIELLVKQEKFDEAVLLAETVLDKCFDEKLNYYLTTIYLGMNAFDKVIRSTEMAIREKTNSLFYYTALYFNALAHKRNGENAAKMFENAIKELRQACSQNPGVVDLYIYRALCYRELKNYERAYEMIDYILALDITSAEALLIRSELNKDLGKMKEYEKDRKEALARNPKLENMIM